MLLGFVLLIACITLYQEHKTERTLEALRDLASPRALVIRDAKQLRIPGREVVRGDIIMLSEGDRVPADGTLLYACNLSVDESLLTGESLPVNKSTANASDVSSQRPGGDNATWVYSGSLVVQGTGFAQVAEIGARTQIGRIGKAIQSIEPEKTLLQKETARWVRILAILGLVICVFVVVLYGITRGNWLDGILAGLTLGHGHTAERTAGGSYNLPGAGRMAHFKKTRPYQESTSDRSPGLSLRTMCRQDRHSHDEPHGSRAFVSRPDVAHRRGAGADAAARRLS